MDESIRNEYPETYKALLESFSWESEARNKYDFYAKVARKSWHPKVADFFEETAKNEMQHAKLLFKLLSWIWNTEDNLKDCIEGEKHEHTSMYPKFEAIAAKEGFKEAELLFWQLSKIEKSHEERFKRLLSELEDKTLYSSKTWEPIAWICQVCWNIEYWISAPNICPVCAHPKWHFERMQENY